MGQLVGDGALCMDKIVGSGRRADQLLFLGNACLAGRPSTDLLYSPEPHYTHRLACGNNGLQWLVRNATVVSVFLPASFPLFAHARNNVPILSQGSTGTSIRTREKC